MAYKENDSDDYLARSEKFKAEQDDIVAQAIEHLKISTLNAAVKVTSLLEASGDVPTLRLQFDAAKSILKYNGLETENIKHSGEVKGLNIFIPERDGGGKSGS